MFVINLTVFELSAVTWSLLSIIDDITVIPAAETY